MQSEKAILGYLKKRHNKKRYNHTVSIVKTAVSIAKYYSIDINKVRIAALLHDCDRDILHVGRNATKWDKMIPELIHERLSAKTARHKFKIKDKNILTAIRHHAKGKAGMSKLTKILFVSDLVEPTRNLKGTSRIRKLAYKDLDKAVIEALKYKMRYFLSTERYIHPATISLWNDILKKRKE